MKRLPWIIGIGYPILLFGILYLVASGDPFAIFDDTYLMGTGVLLPAIVLTASFMIIRRTGERFWGPAIVLGLWVAAMTLAHFWVVAQIAGGV